MRRTLRLRIHVLPFCIALLAWLPGAAQVEEKVLGVPWDFQHKDTFMLCLEGDEASGAHPWDAPHTANALHGNTYCARAATSMIANYFLQRNGRTTERLSQDYISYMVIGQPHNRVDGLPPDYAFKHGGFSGHLLEWALGTPVEEHTSPPFSQIRDWIDADRPMAVAWDYHYRVIDGYRVDALGNYVHLLDPGNPGGGPAWVQYESLGGTDGFACSVCPSEAPGVMADDPRITMHSDSDGIVDFDEVERFGTDPFNPDSDFDGVPDKEDMREYLYDAAGAYGPPEFLQQMRDELVQEYPTQVDGDYVVLRCLLPWEPICPYTDLDLNTGAEIPWTLNWPVIEKVRARADFDDDGLRKELDPDNDDDGLLDGEEDLNANGIFEPRLDETSNFNPDRTPPVTFLAVGEPSYLDTSGRLCVTPMTEHTLSAADSGPVDFIGILAIGYRSYPGASSIMGFQSYEEPFTLSGDDGEYTIEHYAKDLAGNNGEVQTESEYLDTTPPEVACPPPATVECDDPATDPAVTGQATAVDGCTSDPSISYADEETPGECAGTLTVRRIWTATDAFDQSSACESTVEVVDTTPPDGLCNAPAAITPPDAPVSFTASATDGCDGSPVVEITGYDCYAVNGSGRPVDKTESCVVQIAGDTITILDSGGVGDHIAWTLRSVDCSGNVDESTCEVVVVQP
jgi:hypothetical protein